MVVYGPLADDLGAQGDQSRICRRARWRPGLLLPDHLEGDELGCLSQNGTKNRYRWLHGGYMSTKVKKPATD